MPQDPIIGFLDNPPPEFDESPMGLDNMSYQAGRAEDAIGMPEGETPLQDLLLAAKLMKDGLTEQAQMVYQRAMAKMQSSPQGQQVLDAAGAVGGAMGDAAGMVGNAAGAVGGAMGDAAGAVGGAVGDAAGAIGDMGQGAYDAAAGAINSPAAQLAGGAVGQLAGRGADVVGQGMDAVGGMVGQGMDAAGGLVDQLAPSGGFMDRVGSGVQDLASQAAVGGFKGIDQGLEAIGGATDAAGDGLQELMAAGEMAKQGMQEEAAALYDAAMKKIGLRERSMMERAGGAINDLMPNALTGKGAAIDAIGSLFK